MTQEEAKNYVATQVYGNNNKEVKAGNVRNSVNKAIDYTKEIEDKVATIGTKVGGLVTPKDTQDTTYATGIADDKGNLALGITTDGDIATKKFSSANATQTTNTDYFALAIGDKNKNVALAVDKYGNLYTKKFNSAKANDACVRVLEDESENLLSIGDSQGNIVSLIDKNGNLITPNFNSQNGGIESVLKGKKVAFIGDSITEGYNANPRATNRYSSLFCSYAQCTEINLGLAGDTIGIHETYRGGFITRAEQVSTADLVFVFGGTNDFTYNPDPIGSYFSETDITSSGYVGNKKKGKPTNGTHGITFAGAVHELILKIRETAPAAQLVFITPLNRCAYSEGRPTSAQTNKNGDYLQDYIHCIDTICEFYAVPVMHLGQMLNADFTYDRDSGHTLGIYDGDGIHPNNLGHERIAKLIFKWVQSNLVI